MKHLKNYFTNYTAISILVVGLFFTTVTAFKPAEQEKQVMTIDTWTYGPTKSDLGIYVFVDGKKLEFINTRVDHSPEGIVERGEIFNATLSKYYKQGWTIVSTISPPVTAGSCFSSYTLVK